MSFCTFLMITRHSFMQTTEKLIKKRLEAAGVFKSGIAEVQSVDDATTEAYRKWLAEGKHGEMGYLENYPDIRSNPALLLPGAKSIISCAFNYYHGPVKSPLQWASYSLGDDYHDVVRKRLQSVAAWISEEYGAECRVCVDTAPIHERYWAVRSGIGFIGRNQQLILPGAGTHFFLGEIITTLELTPDPPCTESCLGCDRCLRACPGKALSHKAVCPTIPPTTEQMVDTAMQPTELAENSELDAKHRMSSELDARRGLSYELDARRGLSHELDARRCLSYLTIEYRGDFPAGTHLGKHIYGCDVCQEVCPHNANAPLSEIEEFRPRQAILSLDTEAILAMKQEEFSTLFRRSAIKRTKLTGLQRNALQIRKNTQ